VTEKWERSIRTEKWEYLIWEDRYYRAKPSNRVATLEIWDKRGRRWDRYDGDKSRVLFEASVWLPDSPPPEVSE
jgi:hypothetical protein